MKRSALAASISLFILSGCGGGSDIGPVASPDPSLPITSANAMTVSRVAYEASLSSQNAGTVDGGGGIITSAPGGTASSANKLGSSILQVPIPAETTPCAVDGTSTVSGEIADIVTPTISAGDFILIEYDACDEGLNEIVDGSVRTDFEAFSGDIFTGLFQMTATMTFGNFQLSIFDGQSATPIEVLTTNGAITLTLDSTRSPFISTGVDGDSITFDTSSSSETLTNFVSNSTLDGNLFPAPYTETSAGTLDSTQLSGVISYSTPVEFAGVGDEFPSSGEFVVTGSNSSLRLVAVDNVNVRIEIDLGADGSIDETINTTWAELLAS